MALHDVVIGSGRLAGQSYSNDTVIAFYGILFTVPPIGNLRWRTPQPDVPFPSDFVTNAEDRMTLDFISSSVSVGRATGTTPGAPAARLAILRKAFEDTPADLDFIAEATKEGALIARMDGATPQNRLNTPRAIRDRFKAAIPEQL